MIADDDVEILQIGPGPVFHVSLRGMTNDEKLRLLNATVELVSARRSARDAEKRITASMMEAGYGSYLRASN